MGNLFGRRKPGDHRPVLEADPRLRIRQVFLTNRCRPLPINSQREIQPQSVCGLNQFPNLELWGYKSHLVARTVSWQG